jgi:hypothetical protein
MLRMIFNDTRDSVFENRRLSNGGARGETNKALSKQKVDLLNLFA